MRDRHTQPSKWARVACNVADLQPTTLRQAASTPANLELDQSRVRVCRVRVPIHAHAAAPRRREGTCCGKGGAAPRAVVLQP